MTEVLVVCGVGGAGKTTTAAVLGLAHAMSGRRVVVLTIDPARRLADAIGLPELGNTPVPLDLDAVAPERATGGRLDALMLDRKATWDELVRRHAASPDVAERLMANPYYRALSERLSGGHEYMATEKLHALAHDGRWDLVIVDTPSQHALDFFRAPERIRRILDQRLLAGLLEPQGGLLGFATRRVTDLVRRLAGDAVIADLTEFFQLVGDMATGLRERGREVSDLLRGAEGQVGARFVLVISARAPQREEVAPFLDAVRDQGLRFGGFILNRASLRRVARPTVLPPPPVGWTAPAWEQALGTLLARADALNQAADADARLAIDLTGRHGGRAWLLADRPEGLADLAALADAARRLVRPAGARDVAGQPPSAVPQAPLAPRDLP